MLFLSRVIGLKDKFSYKSFILAFGHDLYLVVSEVLGLALFTVLSKLKSIL